MKMRKTVDVEVGQFYRVKIKNRTTYLGYWDNDSDWFIEGEGLTPEEAVLDSLERATDYEVLNIEVESVVFDLVDFVVFENNRYEFVSEKNECLDILSSKEVAEIIKNSEALAEAKERKAIKKKQEKKEIAEKKEAEEKAEWERLNKKFANTKDKGGYDEKA